MMRANNEIIKRSMRSYDDILYRRQINRFLLRGGGKWICGTCTFINFDGTKCEMCETPRNKISQKSTEASNSTSMTNKRVIDLTGAATGAPKRLRVRLAGKTIVRPIKNVAPKRLRVGLAEKTVVATSSTATNGKRNIDHARVSNSPTIIDLMDEPDQEQAKKKLQAGSKLLFCGHSLCVGLQASFKLDNIDQIIQHLKSDVTKYGTAKASNTTVKGGFITIEAALKDKKLYLQFGLRNELIGNHPIAVALSAMSNKIVRGRTSSYNYRLQLFNKYLEHIKIYFDNWLATFEKVAPVFKSDKIYTFVNNDMPMWINGEYTAVTKTHYDDYFNFVYVLQGKKTFYLAEPSAIKVDGNMRSKIDGRLVSLEHNEAPWVIPSNSNFDLNCAYYMGDRPHKQIKMHMYEYTIIPGTMLMIPPGYWHRVISDPKTIMINFWYKPISA